MSVTITKNVCNATNADRVKGLVMSIPKEIKAKVAAIALVRDKIKNNCTTSIDLPQIQGGRSTKVTIGAKSVHPESVQLTQKEVQQMSSKSHLTREQQESIMADLRVKFGRKNSTIGV